ARNMREALEVGEIAELQTAGRGALVAARLDPQHVSRRDRRADRLPQVDDARPVRVQSVRPDNSGQALGRTRRDENAPPLEPAVGVKVHEREAKDLSPL